MKQYISRFIPRQPQHWFATIAIVFGLCFTFITPPYLVPDELGHVARAYGISTGNWLSTVKDGHSGSNVPLNLQIVGLETTKHSFTLGDIARLQSVPLAPTNTLFPEHPNMALYSPVVYAPQAAGFIVARTVQLPAIDALYLARIFNLLVYTAIVFLAIRLLPFGKWAGVVVGLLPMHILLAGSISADPMSIGLAILFVAVVLKIRTIARPLARHEFWWLAGLVAAVSLTKLPVPLLLLLCLLIPVSALGGTRAKWWLRIAGLAAIAVFIGIGWLALAQHTLVAYGPAGVNAAAQIGFVLHHPLGFVKTLLATLFAPAGNGFIGQYVVSIGFVEATVPLWVSYLYGIFLFASFYPLRSASIATLGKWQKLAVAGLGAACIGVICFLLYLSWTPVGGIVIDGMQARYLTPFLILLIPLLAIRSSKKNAQESLLPVWMFRAGAVFFLAASLLMSIYFFYIQ
jgi:uncharacterized membrane protein